MNLIIGAETNAAYIAFSPELLMEDRWGCPFCVINGVVVRIPKSWSSPRAKRIRRYVLERDHWTCRRCGAWAEPSDYPLTNSLTKRNWRHPEWQRQHLLLADHIVPRRLGGTNHPNNLQALCEGCNIRKAMLEERPNSGA